MPKRVRTIRDTVRHRRIARSHPLSRIPEGMVIGTDVYHSTPSAARLTLVWAGVEATDGLVGAA